LSEAQWTFQPAPDVWSVAEAAEAHGKYDLVLQAIADRTIEFLRTTQQDLRAHTQPHPVPKTIDAYQWILLLSAQCRRHSAQIEEVKAHPQFPKR
jgi:hypothetical protein